MNFDLINDKWVPVVDIEGTERPVGLAEVLLGAHRFRRIVGETPPMTAALYRLVLAFAHRVYGPASDQVWAQLWKAEELPRGPLKDYLVLHPGRFDLFDADQPFLQCPAVAGSSVASTAKLVSYRAVGNNATLFDHTTAKDRRLLAPAEAARWLVTAQAYDTGGLKTPYRTVKSSKKAPCNSFGCVLVEGGTLKETLLLNMLVYDPESERPAMTTSADRPAWEDPAPLNPEPDTRVPHGWTDSLTWPSRRIMLSTHETIDGTVVDGVAVTPGTALRGELRHLELMAAFRRLPGKARSKEPRPFLPVRLEERRGAWRHSQELLLAGDVDRQRPRALDQLSERMWAELIPEDTVYTLRVFGQQLDRNGGAIECWFEEEVPAPVALLRAESSRVGRLIGLAVTLADDVGSALRGMERDYNKEFRAKPSNDLELAYWPRLARPFGFFLRSLGEALQADDPEMPAVQEWGRVVRNIAHRAANQWAEGSPRQTRGLLVAGKLYGTFTGRLEYLVKRFETESRAYATAEETV